MSLVKKIKDILFEVEEDDNVNENVDVIKIKDESENTNNNVKVEETRDFKEEKIEKREPVPSERELFKLDNNTFTFPDFDEEEFQSNYPSNNNENSIEKVTPKENTLLKENTPLRQNNNVLEFERKKNLEKRNEYAKYERQERNLDKNIDKVEKKKFKPSPIISPVFGVLNKDYKSSDIVDRTDTTNIDVDYVRKKAFEPVKKEKIEMPKISDFTEESISEPVVTFFEERDEINLNNDNKPLDNQEKNSRTIDSLLEEASDEINLEDTLEIPVSNNLEVIEEELEKISEEEKQKDADENLNDEFSKNLDSAIDKSLSDEAIKDEDIDNDLFELIDSIYDEREEG